MATLELLHIGSCHRWQSKVHLTRVFILLTHCLPGKINWKSIVGGCRSDRRSLFSYCQYWLTPIHVIGFVFVIFFSMFSIFFLSPPPPVNRNRVWCTWYSHDIQPPSNIIQCQISNLDRKRIWNGGVSYCAQTETIHTSVTLLTLPYRLWKRILPKYINEVG